MLNLQKIRPARYQFHEGIRQIGVGAQSYAPTDHLLHNFLKSVLQRRSVGMFALWTIGEGFLYRADFIAVLNRTNQHSKAAFSGNATVSCLRSQDLDELTI